MIRHDNKYVIPMFITILYIGSIAQTSPVSLSRCIPDLHPNPLEIKETGSASYKLLIITPALFYNELKRLQDHKDSTGLPTMIVNLSEIYNQFKDEGRDNAERIKYYIKYAIEEYNIQYVLLVGGRSSPFSWYLPVRYVHMEDTWESSYISDLYYADIYDANGSFCSWDSDNDGIYGEWYINSTADDVHIDLYPDVALGRLACRSRYEVSIMVDKIISYEKGRLDQCNDSWFKRFLVVAGDTYPEHINPNWSGYEGEYYGDRAIENMSGFIPTRLYTSDGSFSSKTDVINAFNNGYGFVYFVGHGSPKTWGNHPPDSEDFVKGLLVNDMWRLRNGYRLPVCVVSGCHNCQFDVDLLKFFNKTTRYRQEALYECWGWRMTTQRRGGSIATVGCTALGYTKEDKQSFKGGLNEIEVLFFNVYDKSNMTTLGDVFNEAITMYLDTYPVNTSTPGCGDSWIDAKVVQSWVLLGDPSLRIRDKYI
ncbi:MAG: C25 family cysteine peptidase [Candidatus Thermoplasmatota archaeon]